MKYIKYLTALLIFLIGIPLSISYKVDDPDEVVHQYITNESILVWKDVPFEIQTHAKNRITRAIDADYDIGDDIISDSGEEDKGISLPFLNHFWNPDDPDTLTSGIGDYDDGLGTLGSSFVKAKEIWLMNIIPNYLNGNINQSYYHLGRVAHLTEDATQASHVHLDRHLGHQLGGLVCGGTNDYCDDSFLEEFTVLQNFWGHGTFNYRFFDGKDYKNQYYRYENLTYFTNAQWEAVNNRLREASYPKELFKIFWYTAQKTQYFASDGNFVYLIEVVL